jgi:hypothetical protein
MSALSVRIVQPAHDDAADAEAGASASGAAADVQALPFFSGNPRVERISGVVHLYRPSQSDAGAAGSPGGGAPAGAALPATDTMCVLGVPGSLAVSDFCQFCGAMLPRIADMRLVRDEQASGDDVFRYAVLLRFDTAAAAVEFYRFYHGRAVRRAVCAGRVSACADAAAHGPWRAAVQLARAGRVPRRVREGRGVHRRQRAAAGGADGAAVAAPRLPPGAEVSSDALAAHRSCRPARCAWSGWTRTSAAS